MKDLAEPFSDHTHKVGECGFCGGPIEVIFGQSVALLEVQFLGKFRLHAECVPRFQNCLDNGGIMGLPDLSLIRKAQDDWTRKLFRAMNES